MKKLLSVLALSALACGGGSDGDSTSSGDAGRDGPTSAQGADAPAPTPEAGAPASDGATTPPTPFDAGPCSASTCATISGKVMRRPDAKPQNGGKGHIYVALFDRDPASDQANAKVVVQARIESADMTPDDASYPYTLGDVHVRSEPYFVVGFLDDNGNVNAAAPGPDKGDLVTLEGFGMPKLKVASPGPMTYDVRLSTAMPF